MSNGITTVKNIIDIQQNKVSVTNCETQSETYVMIALGGNPSNV
jgi:hypothetical protein